jgi:ribosomal protein L37E
MYNTLDNLETKRCARCGYNENQKYLHDIEISHIELPDEGLQVPLKTKERVMKKGKLHKNIKQMTICNSCAFDLFASLEQWFQVIDPVRPSNEQLDLNP